MADFSLAHAFTAKWEGGISDHPDDKGGYTAYGVSTEFLKDFAKNSRNADFLKNLGLAGSVNRALMKKIDSKKAVEIFRFAFWLPLTCSLYSQAFATTLYDAAVNHGKAAAVRLAQRAWNTAKPRQVLATDGILGPKSLAAFSAADERVAQIAIQKRRDYYQAIVGNNPSQKVFLKGWLNRANALDKYLKNFDE